MTEREELAVGNVFGWGDLEPQIGPRPVMVSLARDP
jgi:hypothetical protein